MSGLLRLEEARERMLAGIVPLPAADVALEAAVGRVLAEPVVARVTLPPWDNSAMDGFAVRSEDVAAADELAPVSLRVVGEVAAGHAPGTRVEAGTAVRVLTGAMMPPGADAVVPVEATDAPEGASALPARVSIRQAGRPGQHVRPAGGDVRAGDTILPAGAQVQPPTLALLAATGHASARVHRAPRVAVLATGDELRPVGLPLGPAQIHDSNGPMLAAQAAALGAESRRLEPAPDVEARVLEALRGALGWADVVVVSGGVSVGAHDVVKSAFEALGRLELWRVAVQPGKPLAFARSTGAATGRLLFGLPGNPVSSFVTFELFVRPVLRALAGHADPTRQGSVTARLAEPVVKALDRRAFLRVTLAREAGNGLPVARSSGGQGSHVLSALARADGLAVVPEGVAGLPAGAEVQVLLLDPTA